MRKVIQFLFLFICIAVVIGVYEFFHYPIPNNATSIEQHLRKWESKGTVNGPKPIDIRDIRQIDDSDTYVALYTIPGDKEGMAVLKEGWSKRLRIEVSTKTSNLVEYEDLHTNKGTYALFIGKNPSKQIHRVKASLVNDNYTFEVNVPKEEYFVLYKKVPKYVKETFPAETTLLNSEGDDITVKEYMDQELRE
ncbi:hypothetical protein FZC66_07075 [Priestia megaterium]|nr:hypothetical protein FZC66_07075 [Priestia megaterium]